MENKEFVIVVDFGGQYNQLIARRVRENHVYCEVYPYNKALDKIKELKPQGIIFTGGPNSVYEENSPKIEKEIFELGIPVLGMCYGMQFMAHTLGGEVKSADNREFGKTPTKVDTTSPLFKGLDEDQVVWMSHVDYVAKVPEGFEIIAHTKDCPVASMQNKERKLYAMQYHAEVLHTEHGKEMLHNFLYEVCGFTGTWTMANYAKTAIEEIRNTVGDGKVLLALSGGVDSSVAAALISKAVGDQLTCIFVDHGLMRKNEGDEVEAAFKDSGMHFIRVDAEKRFLDKLAGLDRDINQYFAVLTSTRTVGVMGDFRTYDYTLALRGVTTTDFMTADWARIPYDVLDTISRRIVNEVQHINRIVYDITSKPPATIEWE